MKKIQIPIILNILIVLIWGALWHGMEMNDQRHIESVSEKSISDRVTLLRSYRDVLRTKGIQGAKAYLQDLPRQKYGI